MSTEVKLPRLGQGMESGTIVRWLKAEGDPVKQRDPLYELDTDKVTQEVEAEVDGVLLRIVVAEGEVEVGKTIAVIGLEGEDPSSAGPAADEQPRAGACCSRSRSDGSGRRRRSKSAQSRKRRPSAAMVMRAARFRSRRVRGSRPRRSRDASRGSAGSISPRCPARDPTGESSPKMSSGRRKAVRRRPLRRRRPRMSRSSS